MKHLILAAIIFASATSGFLRAADTWDIPFNHIELKSHRPDVEVILDVGGKDTHPMKVALKWNGRDYSVPASEFAGIADVCMASVRIVSTMPPKLVVSPPDGGFAFIAVCMEYGDPILMKGREPVSGEAIYHRARAFFLFDKKGYSHRSRLVPIEKDNKWRLLYKDVATQEQGFGEESGPFEPNSPPMVPVTEWPDAEIPSAPPSADRTTAIPRKAEQADADQPLTKPANKTPTEVHPPLPTSEDAPR